MNVKVMVEDIHKLVRIHWEPSSLIVYSFIRTYFDNSMMDKVRMFRDEIRGGGTNLRASATRSIEEVFVWYEPVCKTSACTNPCGAR